jgi:predicted Zn finger-like uncharacterized protein
MIVVCPACAARFQYDESRFQGAAAKRFRCPKCSHIFEVENPTLGSPQAAFPEFGHTVPMPDPTVSAPEPTVAFKAAPLPPPVPNARTTARRDREAMLTAAGIQGPGMPQNMRFSLAGLSGPMASTVQVLEKPLVLIGREDGDIVTKDPETSRRHASLEIHQDGTVWLMDLDSTNGTFLDGLRITGKMQLENQQEFSCGNSTFMLMIRNLDDFQMH